MSFTGNQETLVVDDAIQPSPVISPLPEISPVDVVIASPVNDIANIESSSPLVSPVNAAIVSPVVDAHTADIVQVSPIQHNVHLFISTTTNFTQPTQQYKPKIPPVNIPTNLPVLTKQPTGEGIEIKRANQISNIDPSKTIEFYLSIVAEQSMVDGTSMEVYHTETFAAIRPMFDLSAGIGVHSSPGVSLLLLLVSFGLF